MASHSSILAWRIPWMEEPRRLESTGLQRAKTAEQRVDVPERLHFHFPFFQWDEK